MRIELKRGLNVRLPGAPRQVVSGALPCTQTAHELSDFYDLRARMIVAEGDSVALGQPLFFDRKHPQIVFSASSAGVVRYIDRGAGRRITRVIIERDGNAATAFPQYDQADVARMPADTVREHLLAAGAWSAFRARPYDRVPPPTIEPRGIFVTAIDSNPLAPDPAVVLAARHDAFAIGVTAIARLTQGNTYICTASGADIRLPIGERLIHAEFAGAHPAGLPGTHIHAVGLPIGAEPDLWHIGYQDVVAIGELLLTGRASPERVIAIGGSAATRPRLVVAPLGSDLHGLADEHTAGEGCQIVSGSPLHGTPNARYLGRYHNQLSLLRNDPVRESSIAARLRSLLRGKRALSEHSATTGGWPLGMLPVEAFEQVWPFSTPAMVLLRALLAGDTEAALQAGCSGLSEEDLALCAYVCPAGRDYGAALRTTLQRIEALG